MAETVQSPPPAEVQTPPQQAGKYKLIVAPRHVTAYMTEEKRERWEAVVARGDKQETVSKPTYDECIAEVRKLTGVKHD